MGFRREMHKRYDAELGEEEVEKRCDKIEETAVDTSIRILLETAIVLSECHSGSRHHHHYYGRKAPLGELIVNLYEEALEALRIRFFGKWDQKKEDAILAAGGELTEEMKERRKRREAWKEKREFKKSNYLNDPRNKF